MPNETPDLVESSQDVDRERSDLSAEGTAEMGPLGVRMASDDDDTLGHS